MSNMLQGHYIREKGFAMGRYSGKIVSPITGKEEIKYAEAGYFFETTPENLSKWRSWWKAANWEHWLSFFCLTAISIVLLSFLSYHTVFGVEGYSKGISFIRGEAEVLARDFGGFYRNVFLTMGWAILFTSQIGVIDLFSRLSTDIIKWYWLREAEAWTESRIYFVLVIFITVFAIIVFAVGLRDPRTLLTIGAAISGCVMFIYSILLLYVNRFKLPREVRMSRVRTAIMIWAIGFFGFFSILTIKVTLVKLFG
jgi:Mn2+/Fe2+ NRAMP family transporter